jgi:microcystin-dependent protein
MISMTSKYMKISMIALLTFAMSSAGTTLGQSSGVQPIPPAYAGQDAFLGEIMWVAFTFAPRSFANCDGQLMPIAQNTALFSLLGTTYGGDGRTTFALPDMRGRSPVDDGRGPGLSSIIQGQRGGVERVTLTLNQIPSHTHQLMGADNVSSQQDLDDNVLGERRGQRIFAEDTASLVSMSTQAIQNAGGGQSHENRDPYLAIKCTIALQGLFPSRN